MENKMVLALFEEYKRAIADFINVLQSISEEEFNEIKDFITKDEDCKSIKSITHHIIQSGYTYANYINTISDNEWLEYQKDIINIEFGISEINNMLDYSKSSLLKVASKTNKELEIIKFETRWKVTYDFEQLLAHAIVHILRHRRQVENMLK